ncbi:type II toxin-antitoxin system HigB family toxin [uncultured Aquimarina sp.]|uniref:type II toxin-antitoxin system HigB family toxin n=1 Tax=uncultured Aquimarina sp. TaxID=575652 RepID=UPI00260593F8|nr:type II toxin-antitoxin system HigB family toxin [uncultured Aquimarina sp.]
MRVLKRKTLLDYWKKNPESKKHLEIWFSILNKESFNSPNEIKQIFGSADFIGENIAIFNIAGNKYRLIARIRYDIQITYIRFIGTHAEYDKLDLTKL